MSPTRAIGTAGATGTTNSCRSRSISRILLSAAAAAVTFGSSASASCFGYSSFVARSGPMLLRSRCASAAATYSSSAFVVHTGIGTRARAAFVVGEGSRRSTPMRLPTTASNTCRPIRAFDAGCAIGRGISSGTRTVRFESSSNSPAGQDITNDDSSMRLVELQKLKAAESARSINSAVATGKSFNTVSDHLNHQKATFDSLADFFGSDEATPDDVRPILRSLVGRALARMVELSTNEDDVDTYRVLDVGCGTGALFPYYAEAADALAITLTVTGADLSGEMTSLAISNADDLMMEQTRKHRFEVVTGDFVRLILGEGYDAIEDDGLTIGTENDDTNVYRGKYDAVVVNACFGNFYNVDALLSACAQSLTTGGVACITHPLGSGFVRKLHEESPDTVPNCLPTKDVFDALCFHQPLDPIEFEEDLTIPTMHEGDESDGGGGSGAYFACARRTPHSVLPRLMRFRGDVAKGYGRGGKELGFPTANLPSSLFAESLAGVRTGVYFGWAVIEGNEDDDALGRNVPHKAVVNVGFSPTFEGSENVEKIIEVHLMPDEELSDFYGQKMRLILGGFLRPERKFPSFPDLVAAINNDVDCAKAALDIEGFSTLQSDALIGDDGADWIGKDGGDDEASWEFEAMGQDKYFGWSVIEHSEGRS